MQALWEPAGSIVVGSDNESTQEGPMAKEDAARDAREEKLDMGMAAGTVAIVVVAALVGFLYLMLYDRTPTGSSATSAPNKQTTQPQTTTRPTPTTSTAPTQPSTK